MGAAPLTAWDEMHLTGALLAPAFNEVDAYISYSVREREERELYTYTYIYIYRQIDRAIYIDVSMYRANSGALLAPALNEVDAYISYSVINK